MSDTQALVFFALFGAFIAGLGHWFDIWGVAASALIFVALAATTTRTKTP